MARQEAERLLESKSLELYTINERLREFVEELERQVEKRTVELRLALSHAEHMMRRKSNFLAAVSHEIRTPLNGIVGSIAVLKEKENNEERLRYIDALEACSEQLLHVVNDTLDISAVDSGALAFRVKATNLRASMESLRAVYLPLANNKNLELVLVVAEDFPALLDVDEMRIRQIMSNLLSNALKYTQKGTVTIEMKTRAHNGGDDLCLDVTDTGSGIESALLPHIFDAFRRGRSEQVERIQGTGLGLALSAKLATLLGGTLTVTSTVGRGSCFSLTLPVVRTVSDDAQHLMQSDAATAREADLATQEYSRRDLHVLVVDDNEVNLMLLAEMLGPRVRRVTQASDGVEAVALLLNESFGLIILDIRMPKMNGLEVARRIRADRQHAQVPIIGLSASVTAEERLQAVSAGFDVLLEKPIKPVALLQVISDTLQEKRSNSR